MRLQNPISFDFYSNSCGGVGVGIMVFQSLSAAATIEKQLLRLKLHLAPATNSSNCNSQQISSDFHLKFAS